MGRKNVAKITTSLLALTTVAGLLAGCGTENTKQGGVAVWSTAAGSAIAKPHEGGSIQIDSTSAPDNLDPAKGFDGASEEAVLAMYDQLVTYKGSTSEIVPSLAQSWTVSPDGKTYTFHLRHNVKFWNGDALTAESFINEFERVLSTTINSPVENFIDPIIAGSTAYHQGKAKSVVGLQAPNSNTLVIHLTEAVPYFLEILAMPTFSAVDQQYINKVGEDKFDTTSPMGTGPFELQGDTPNVLTFMKNKSYWHKDQYGNQLPYLDKITVNVNPNGQLDALRFSQGTTALMGQLTDGIPSSSYAMFTNSPALRKDIVRATRNATFYLGLNTKMAPLNNVKVRQAIEYAIDKASIVKLTGGLGQVANQPLPPGIKGYVTNLPANLNYTYNPSKAKALLKQAGYAKGTSITLYTYDDPTMMSSCASITSTACRKSTACI